MFPMKRRIIQKKKSRGRGKYKCSKCGRIKKGHKCDEKEKLNKEYFEIVQTYRKIKDEGSGPKPVLQDQVIINETNRLKMEIDKKVYNTHTNKENRDKRLYNSENEDHGPDVSSKSLMVNDDVISIQERMVANRFCAMPANHHEVAPLKERNQFREEDIYPMHRRLRMVPYNNDYFPIRSSYRFGNPYQYSYPFEDNGEGVYPLHSERQHYSIRQDPYFNPSDQLYSHQFEPPYDQYHHYSRYLGEPPNSYYR